MSNEPNGRPPGRAGAASESEQGGAGDGSPKSEAGVYMPASLKKSLLISLLLGGGNYFHKALTSGLSIRIRQSMYRLLFLTLRRAS